MMKHAALALALVSGVSLIGAPASAQILNASTSLDVETNLVGATVDTSISTDATSSDDGSGMATGTDAQPGAARSGMQSGLSFSLDRDTLDEGTEYSVSDAESVQTAAGLESYAATSVRADERVESVTLEDGTLEVAYKTDARFLGFIPASMTMRARVLADGTVDVRYPWYAFLMATDEKRADLEARLSTEQAAIADDLAEASVNVNAETAEARRWALALERLRMSLYATASAGAQL